VHVKSNFKPAVSVNISYRDSNLEDGKCRLFALPILHGLSCVEKFVHLRQAASTMEPVRDLYIIHEAY
jgi:hypothetical protein